MSTIPAQILAARRSLVAELLRLESGYAGGPCWGLVEPSATVVDVAGVRSAFCQHLHDELTGILPGKARILLIGDGLDSLRKLFDSQKYQVLLAANWCELPDTDKFDAVLVASPFHYRDQLSLLGASRNVLAPGGYLLVYGEFIDDDRDIERSLLANVSSHRQLAERLEFEFIGPQNFSRSARLFLVAMTALLDKHRPAMLIGNDISTEILQAGMAELQQSIEELISGRRCMQLFTHVYRPDEKSPYPNLEYGDIQSFTAAEVADLFQQSFQKQFDPGLWRWKYGLGKGTCVVARQQRGGRIIAHYGGAPREIDYFGTDQMAIQPCDVMVLPEERRQYGRKSLFFKVAATFLEREIGNTVGHLLGFGFPNQKAMNIALRLGLYEKTDDFIELQFPTRGDVTTTEFKISALDLDDPRQRNLVDELWQAMRADFREGIIGKRHAGYLQYRYGQHPAGQRGEYQILQISGPQQLQAVAVIKPGNEGPLLMDLVCPLANMPSAIQAVNQWLADGGQDQGLRFWITRGWAAYLRSSDVIERKLGIEIPCNSWNPGPSAETLYGAWWLTPGDMDFV